jgi:hypothetical protein
MRRAKFLGSRDNILWLKKRRVSPAMLSLILLLIFYVAGQSVPTRKQFRELANQFAEIHIVFSELPPGRFAVEEFTCHSYIEAEGNDCLSCRDTLANMLGFIYFYFRSDNSLFIRNTDMPYERLTRLISVMRTEFQSPNVIRTDAPTQ